MLPRLNIPQLVALIADVSSGCLFFLLYQLTSTNHNVLLHRKSTFYIDAILKKERRNFGSSETIVTGNSKSIFAYWEKELKAS